MINKIILIVIGIITTTLFGIGFVFPDLYGYFFVAALICEIILITLALISVKNSEYSSQTNNKSNEELITFVSNKFYRVLINNENKIYYLSEKTRRELKFQVFDNISMYLPERVIKTQNKEIKVEITGNLFMYYRMQNSIYLWPINEQEKYRKLYSESVNGVGYLLLDNYREMTDNLSESQRYEYLSKFYHLCDDTFNKYNIIGKRISSTKYFFVATIGSYRKLKADGFDILKQINSIYQKDGESLTCSIGFSLNQSEINVTNVTTNANNALNLALERGGNQVVEIINAEMKIIGGNTHTNTVRTKVRVRIFTKELLKRINESDDIILFGHYNIDMDCFASLVTIYEIVKQIDPSKRVRICSKVKGSSYDVRNAFERLDVNVQKDFVTNIEVKQNSLAIALDVSTLSNVYENRLISKSNNLVVIDHHLRESDDILRNASSLIDVNASSTSELIVEILYYAQQLKQISKETLCFLYTGILIDTDNLIQRVSTNTFDALSTLVRHGASVKESFELTQDSYDFIKEKNEVISKAQTFKEIYVIALSEYVWTNTKVAKTANELLKLKDFECSFVISRTKDGIKISGRSNGSINVGNIMKKLKGGGHATIAATLLDTNLENALKQLKQAISVCEGDI